MPSAECATTPTPGSGGAILFVEMKKQSGFREEITRRLVEALGVTLAVRLEERKSPAQREGKAMRVVDRWR